MKKKFNFAVGIFLLIGFATLSLACETLGQSLGQYLVGPDGQTLADRQSGVIFEYEIGDRGPAGGLIFYMRSSSEGRQYWEVAPADMPRAANWDRAVQLCREYSVNGFNDWFLPSRTELSRMYTNLHTRRLGVFKVMNVDIRQFGNDYCYWSSTEDPSILMGAYNAYAVDFRTSEPFLLGKNIPSSVRAIRTFTIR